MGYDMYWVESPPDEDDAYFRLNIWGMGRMREIMWDLDMLCDYGYPEPLTDDVLAWHDTSKVGIAAYKFGSNDGWLVTPAEITAALAIADMHAALGEPQFEDNEGETAEYWQDIWKRWLEWMKGAANHGGFRVY